MSICNYCGDEIEFRYKDGRRTPIHVNGGWCDGLKSKPTSEPAGEFSSALSYVNPNAICPVCKKTVFFYKSPFGGKVFFDDLGWPWPKHGCTNLPQAQNDPMKRVAPKSSAPFKNRAGEILRIYNFLDLTENEEGFSLRIFFDNKLQSTRIAISFAELQELLLTSDDLRKAPSFIVRTYPNHRTIEFISGRKQAIVSLKVPRAKPNS